MCQYVNKLSFFGAQPRFFLEIPPVDFSSFPTSSSSFGFALFDTFAWSPAITLWSPSTTTGVLLAGAQLKVIHFPNSRGSDAAGKAGHSRVSASLTPGDPSFPKGEL